MFSCQQNVLPNIGVVVNAVKIQQINVLYNGFRLWSFDSVKLCC